MNQIKILCIAVVMFSMSHLLAQDKTVFKAKDPVLITSAGQSADVLMAKILATKAGIEYDLDKMAKPENLDGKNSLIIVSGGSTKATSLKKPCKTSKFRAIIDCRKFHNFRSEAKDKIELTPRQ